MSCLTFLLILQYTKDLAIIEKMYRAHSKIVTAKWVLC